MAEEKQQSRRISGKRSMQKRSDYGDLLLGKIQPQALPLEEVVLGAIMLDKDAIAIVIDILDDSSFYLDAHQLIYKAMRDLFIDDHPIDLLTVTEKLKKNGDLDKIGGPMFLVELTNRITSSANIEYHARIVAQKHIQRELIKSSTKTITDAYDDTIDVFDLLDNAEKSLFEITEKNLTKSYEPLNKLAARALEELEALATKKEGVTGIPTGFTELDKLTSGWQPSSLNILAARPGMGKTAFVLSLARNAAMIYDKPVAIFSLEMSSIQLTLRLISSEASIESSKLKNAQMSDEDWKKVTSATEQLSQANIIIDDTPALNIFELRAKCRRMKLQSDIQMIIIDYLQLMQGGKESGNREQEVSMISRSLKGLAKELDVPVIALSQLNRSVETRGGSKRPQLSDLRESGSIEQDADIVSFIYRPEYYGILEDEEGQSQKGMAEIIIAKHRNGGLGTIKLRFVGEYTRFEDMDVHKDFFDTGDDDLSANPYGNNNNDDNLTLPSRMNEDIPF